MSLLVTLPVWAISLTPLSAATLFFRADLSPDAVVATSTEDDPSGISMATGTAWFTLTTGEPGGPTLSYEILFSGLELDDTLPREVLDGPDDLIRAIHIHFGATGTNGGHALNMYGAPREDDADLVVNNTSSQVTGLWDDSDENLGPDGMLGNGDSVALSDALTELQAGELYIQVHTMGFRDGELRGQIPPIPEPSTLLMGMLSPLLWRRRRP